MKVHFTTYTVSSLSLSRHFSVLQVACVGNSKLLDMYSRRVWPLVIKSLMISRHGLGGGQEGHCVA